MKRRSRNPSHQKRGSKRNQKHKTKNAKIIKAPNEIQKSNRGSKGFETLATVCVILEGEGERWQWRWGWRWRREAKAGPERRRRRRRRGEGRAEEGEGDWLCAWEKEKKWLNMDAPDCLDRTVADVKEELEPLFDYTRVQPNILFIDDDDEDFVYLRPPAKKMKISVPVANGVSNVNSATATYSAAKWLDVKCLRSNDNRSCWITRMMK
ncbi:hypothetical protein Droror1_Dr00019946, partial [Drosera rotundifolia]